MYFVRRNAQGEIIALAKEMSSDYSEEINAHHPEALKFFLQSEEVFNDLDTSLIRVIEDLVDVLIDKNLLRLTDLPLPAQEKLLSRKKVRSSLKNSLNILVDNDQALI